MRELAAFGGGTACSVTSRPPCRSRPSVGFWWSGDAGDREQRDADQRGGEQGDDEDGGAPVHGRRIRLAAVAGGVVGASVARNGFFAFCNDNFIGLGGFSDVVGSSASMASASTTSSVVLFLRREHGGDRRAASMRTCSPSRDLDDDVVALRPRMTVP